MDLQMFNEMLDRAQLVSALDSSPVKVIDAITGELSSLVGVQLEHHDETGITTIWLKTEAD